MLITQLKKLDPVERLFQFIIDREQVRVRKEEGAPKPWTDNEILQQYRFCNVRRMDDKVSDWLYTKWYEPHFDHPNMLLAVALARFVNNPASLAYIGFPDRWTPSTIKRKLREYRDKGNTVFNGAYMVRGNDGEDKIESVVDYYVSPLTQLRKHINNYSMEETHKALMSSYGLGSFMAGQIVADLRWAMDGQWADAKTWAPIGPGSRRGMNRLHGRDLKYNLKQAEFGKELTKLISLGSMGLSRPIISRMEAHDWQNCLCEFDKMERTLFDGRCPKQRYPGVK